MPSRVGRPCSTPGCAAVVRDGRYCPKHAAQSRPPDERPSSNRRGYDKTWRKIRRYILANEPLCRSCLSIGRITAATDVHHIIAKRDGGTNDPENLAALCHSCHSKLTARGE